MSPIRTLGSLVLGNLALGEAFVGSPAVVGRGVNVAGDGWTEGVSNFQQECGSRKHAGSFPTMLETVRLENRRPSPLEATESGGEGEQADSMKNLAKLGISLIIDLIGMSSYAIPGLGEGTDIGWAPVSAALIWFLYGNGIIAGVAFVEEILPGLDVVPTATIAWFLANSSVGKNLASVANREGMGGSPPPIPPSMPVPPAGERRKSGAVDPSTIGEGIVDVESERVNETAEK